MSEKEVPELGKREFPVTTQKRCYDLEHNFHGAPKEVSGSIVLVE